MLTILTKIIEIATYVASYYITNAPHESKVVISSHPYNEVTQFLDNYDITKILIIIIRNSQPFYLSES